MADLPSKDRIDAIMFRLQQKGAVTPEEMKDVQLHIDNLEAKGLAQKSHHHDHDSKILDVSGLEGIQ